LNKIQIEEITTKIDITNIAQIVVCVPIFAIIFLAIGFFSWDTEVICREVVLQSKNFDTRISSPIK